MLSGSSFFNYTLDCNNVCLPTISTDRNNTCLGDYYTSDFRISSAVVDYDREYVVVMGAGFENGMNVTVNGYSDGFVLMNVTQNSFNILPSKALKWVVRDKIKIVIQIDQKLVYFTVYLQNNNNNNPTPTLPPNPNLPQTDIQTFLKQLTQAANTLDVNQKIQFLSYAAFYLFQSPTLPENPQDPVQLFLNQLKSNALLMNEEQKTELVSKMLFVILSA